MAEGDVRKLWKLHQVDEALHEIRARAAALDPGRKLSAELTKLQEELDIAHAEAHKLSSEQSDLELSNQTIDAKVKKFDGDLYGGKVVNPREVENIQKEIEMLKRNRAQNESRILGLWEVVPPAQEKEQAARELVQAKKAELAAHQRKALETKAQLEASFKEWSAKRPEALKAAPAAILPRYEATMKKYGTGMARISPKKACSSCGMAVAEKSIEMVKDDKFVTCEQCHRFLYFSEGVV